VSGPGNSLFQLRGQVVQYSFDQRGSPSARSFLPCSLRLYQKKKKGNMPWCGMVPVPNALTPPGMGCRKKKAPFLLPRAVTYCRIFKCTANHCWSSCASSPCEKKRRKRMVRAGRMSRKPNGNGWRTGAGVPDGRSGGTPWQAGSEPATEGEITRDASLSRRLWVVGEHWLE
jgi:hypothetical protein